MIGNVSMFSPRKLIRIDKDDGPLCGIEDNDAL